MRDALVCPDQGGDVAQARIDDGEVNFVLIWPANSLASGQILASIMTDTYARKSQILI